MRLVLQPMTHSEILRKYLLDNGFRIIDEKLAKEEKIYEIICAEYTGEGEEYSEAELLIGKKNIERGGELLGELVSHHLAILKKIANAKKSASANAEKEDRLIKALEEIKNDSI